MTIMFAVSLKNMMSSNGRRVGKCIGNGALIDSEFNREQIFVIAARLQSMSWSFNEVVMWHKNPSSPRDLIIKASSTTVKRTNVNAVFLFNAPMSPGSTSCIWYSHHTLPFPVSFQQLGTESKDGWKKACYSVDDRILQTQIMQEWTPCNDQDKAIFYLRSQSASTTFSQSDQP